ncbi:hypothetical protein [Microbacterium sp. SLBN-146]|uniref:hypothetical protein n=1 Tax=Microbacterium sp. SLBN-146 TaxID=2768457 RepID=UPI00114D6DB1|nr:hypothetical protein [Microbacterium sp. SLBN-146]TQJ30831.1 hypothetical protein FBY39_1288 [Microbacterium sp. SLBN-146]
MSVTTTGRHSMARGSGSRRSGRQPVLVVATITLASALVGVGAPAYAGDARCTTNTKTDACGSIWANMASSSFLIRTNFSPSPGQTVLGTASGVQQSIKNGTSSNQFKDSSGRYYDWDAVFVPYGKCIAIFGGASGSVQSKYYNSKYSSGVWYKIDNFGASITLKNGNYC